MARTTRRPAAARNGYVLPDDKLRQREFVFAAYRDLGPGRSTHQLWGLLKRDHPDIAVTRPSLERWSRTHDWRAHEGARQGDGDRRTQLTVPQGCVVADPDFDQVDALLSAANQALTRAMTLRLW
jgi:hypothetical protein